MVKRKHVVPSKGKWAVKSENQNRPVSTHDTQRAAEQAAKESLRKGGGEVVIHTPKGVIRDSDTVAPARDPNPPKDTKH